MAQELKDMMIGQPAIRALNAAGINNLLQLCNYTEKEILALHGLGPKAIRLIKESFEKDGLSFK